MTEKLKMNDSGVSPVIGVILMVAITVVLAAVVVVLVSDMAKNQSTEVIDLAVSHDSGDNSYTIIKAPLELAYDDLTLSGCTTLTRGGVAINTATADVLAGDKISGCTGQLTIVYEPTNQLLYKSD